MFWEKLIQKNEWRLVDRKIEKGRKGNEKSTWEFSLIFNSTALQRSDLKAEGMNETN